MRNFPYILRETSEGFRPITLETELLTERVMPIFGMIDDELANFVFAAISYLDDLSENPDSVDMVINSPGGSVDAGLAIYDMIRTSNIPINTIVYGQASSIASILAVCGENRKIYPNSFIMIHEPSGVASSFQASASEMKSHSDILDGAKKKLVDIYVKHTNLTNEQIEEYIRGVGTNINATQAVELGFADEIIPYS